MFDALRARNIPVVLVTHDDEDIPPGGEVIEISRCERMGHISGHARE